MAFSFVYQFSKYQTNRLMFNFRFISDDHLYFAFKNAFLQCNTIFKMTRKSQKASICHRPIDL